jgi:hypothetical protein
VEVEVEAGAEKYDGFLLRDDSGRAGGTQNKVYSFTQKGLIA